MTSSAVQVQLPLMHGLHCMLSFAVQFSFVMQEFCGAVAAQQQQLDGASLRLLTVLKQGGAFAPTPAVLRLRQQYSRAVAAHLQTAEPTSLHSLLTLVLEAKLAEFAEASPVQLSTEEVHLQPHIGTHCLCRVAVGTEMKLSGPSSQTCDQHSDIDRQDGEELPHAGADVADALGEQWLAPVHSIATSLQVPLPCCQYVLSQQQQQQQQQQQLRCLK